MNLGTINTNKPVRKTDTRNNAGGKAYALKEREALAQLAATGTIANTYYTNAKQQLDEIISLVKSVLNSDGGSEFIAKLAIYSHTEAFMKDIPAVLLSFLAVHDPELYSVAFDRVVYNAKMLRNHVQVSRSGIVSGRRALPNVMRRKCRAWLNTQTPSQLFRSKVGKEPSLGDVIKMLHPRPATSGHAAVFAYLIGKPYNFEDLPRVAQQFENYKNGKTKTVPKVPFQLLTSLELGTEEWNKVAQDATWQTARMNLNTFKRHGVLDNSKVVDELANKLSDKELVRKAKAFPYQLFAAYKHATDVPIKISNALQQAMEVATENVPKLDGNIYVFVDVSGSMGQAVTGQRQNRHGANMRTSQITCVEAASVMAAAIARKNPNAVIMPFDTSLYNPEINPFDSIMTNANKLRQFGGWGTSVQLGPRYLAYENKKVDAVIILSDNESWVDTVTNGYCNEATQTLQAWEKIKRRNKNAKMVCIDMAPNSTTQAPSRKDIMNIGGFSDTVFKVVEKFLEPGSENASHWVDTINEIEI